MPITYKGNYVAAGTGTGYIDVPTYGGDIVVINLDTSIGLTYIMMSREAVPADETEAAFIVTGTTVIPNCQQLPIVRLYYRRSASLAFFIGPFNRFPL